MQRITTFWNKGWMGKAVMSIVGLLLACCVFGIFAPRSASQPAASPLAATQAAIQAPEATARPQPTDSPIAAEPTDAPTIEVLATLATNVPAVPTKVVLQERATTAPQPVTAPAPTAKAAPAATDAPAPAASGAAPQGSDCPAEHSIKGNIVDRGANKGEKIYHVPGDNGYAQTKPERCFVDAAEAEAAGFRPVK